MYVLNFLGNLREFITISLTPNIFVTLRSFGILLNLFFLTKLMRLIISESKEIAEIFNDFLAQQQQILKSIKAKCTLLKSQI